MPLIASFIVPHPPILLPGVGSEEKKRLLKKTLSNYFFLKNEVEKFNTEKIVITSPHKDWGFDVPLYFLQNKLPTEKILISTDDYLSVYSQGEEYYNKNILLSSLKVALVASGDLSHRLKECGPYGLHEDGVMFDKELLQKISSNNYKELIKLDKIYPEAAHCGLSSIIFLFGVMSAYSKDTNRDFKIEILSYENPFGVGYLVARYKL